jgi:hypothetical protein
VRSSKELVRSLRIIENEAIVGGAPASLARDVTYSLAKVLVKKIGPSEPVVLQPRAMYYVIVRGAARGDSRGAISGTLKSRFQ